MSYKRVVIFVTFISIVNARDAIRDKLVEKIYGLGPETDIPLTETKNTMVPAHDPQCICVFYYNCKNETIDEYGENVVDVRYGYNPCNHILKKCCELPSTNSWMPGESTPEPGYAVKLTPAPQLAPELQRSYCGIRNARGLDFRLRGQMNEAEYGEFPWMVAILKTNYVPSPDGSLAICGGSLIAPRVVLTGAHCVYKYKADDLKVRAGEWDTRHEDEKDPYQERKVSQIIIHESFIEEFLHSDIALLIVEKLFIKERHIGTICLPDQDKVVSSKECFTTGWGKTMFEKKDTYQAILKKVELPAVSRDECLAELKETRLGESFELHETFICAGGIPGKDACTGDGGGPLVCPDPNQPSRYVQVGIVAWGIGCGTKTPGVYVNVAMFRNWIDDQMRRWGITSDPYIS